MYDIVLSFWKVAKRTIKNFQGFLFHAYWSKAFSEIICTLKSLIEEHARLDSSDFLSTLLAIFHVINKKFQPNRLLTYLVKKQAGRNFFATLLVYSGLLFY